MISTTIDMVKDGSLIKSESVNAESENDQMSKLKMIKKLHDAGILNNNEHEEKKTKILALMGI